jgi:hypothetical protein
LGSRMVERQNPFTGKTQLVPVDDGLSDAERAAVLLLLRSTGAAAPDEFGCYVVELADGGGRPRCRQPNSADERSATALWFLSVP